MNRSILLFFAGLLFAILWSSASTATKLGLISAQPLVICVARFFLAGAIMLILAHTVLRVRLPVGKEWRQLMIYGLLNITIYLGLYVLAMQHVSPGLGSLAVATNPVFINLISALVFRVRLSSLVVGSLVLCSIGVVTAAWPLLQTSGATPGGLLLLLVSMLAYSAGVLYYSRCEWGGLRILAINGWQTLFGGLFILPFAALGFDERRNVWDMHAVGSILWLAVPVSVVAVQLWLYLLRDNATRASFWLFLCPVSGWIIAHYAMGEPIGVYTVVGMGLVIGGLYMVQGVREGGPRAAGSGSDEGTGTATSAGAK